MSPIVGYHATRTACRQSIHDNGLLPAQPQRGRPFGVYVFRPDGEFNHLGWNSMCEWCAGDLRWCDLWEAAYIGPLMPDQYVLNGMVFLEPVTYVSLVTGN